MSDSDLMQMLQSILQTRVAGDIAFGEKVLARLQYCQTHKLEYHGLYTMPQAAVHLCDVSGTTEEDVDTSSIKRWIKAGKLAFVKHGDKGVRMFGYQLADFHLSNIVGEKWDGTERRVASRLATGGSGESLAPTSGIAAAGMRGPDKHIVSALASGLVAKKS